MTDIINFSEAIEMEQNQNIEILSKPNLTNLIFHLVWIPRVKKKKVFFESCFKCTRQVFYLKKKSYGGCFRKTDFVKWIITHWSIRFENVDLGDLICLNTWFSIGFDYNDVAKLVIEETCSVTRLNNCMDKTSLWN